MFRTALLLGILAMMLMGIGFFFAGVAGMTIAFALALLLNFATYWYSSSIVVRMYRARPSSDKELNAIVEKLARNAQIPKPKVYMMQNNAPNAFATGRNKNNAIVAVTSGLMSMDKGEIEAVIGHELGHVKNNDMLISAVAATIAGTISYIAQIGYWSTFSRDGDRGQAGLIGLVLIIIFAPLAAFLVRLAISRGREYKADYASAMYTGKPQNLASALRKIDEIARHAPMRGSTATSHLWIVNPFRGDWFSGLFSTHPPIARRIKRLEEMHHQGHGTVPVLEYDDKKPYP